MHFAVQHPALEGRRENVAEHHERFFIRVRRQSVQARVGMRGAHVLRLGTIDSVAENPSARSAVRKHPLSTQITDPARADTRDEHAVAFAKRRHERTHGLDHAYAFVPKNSAGRDRRDVALQDVQIRAADRRRRDPDHRIARVSNDRLGPGLPRPLVGATVDQRVHHVVRLDTSGHGVGDHFSSPHGQMLQSSLPHPISRERPFDDKPRRAQLIARLFYTTQSPTSRSAASPNVPRRKNLRILAAIKTSWA